MCFWKRNDVLCCPLGTMSTNKIKVPRARSCVANGMFSAETICLSPGQIYGDVKTKRVFTCNWLSKEKIRNYR